MYVIVTGNCETEGRVYMTNQLVMPLGIDRFDQIRTEGYYYIDKTDMIAELLRKTFQVNLITRPRRFGKTLAMDMLAHFFDIRTDSRDLFAGLHISEQKNLCEKWQNQWPVIFLTLKEVDDLQLADAKKKLAMCISDLCYQHRYLLESEGVKAEDKAFFETLLRREADDVELQTSLHVLMRMMEAHFGKQVILLMDEYDVPLAKANENGFYQEMLNLMRGLLNKTLKSNPFLKFAVITGCLRIANESIFTGANNFVSDNITGDRFNEYMGFTKEEVGRLLQDTGFTDHAEEMKRWYDGYRFGSIHIYCPWDVLNHVNALQDNPTALPKHYWENTSHNDILRTFIQVANDGSRPELDVNEKFETLLAGGYIEETIEENLTYDAIRSSEANLWSLLYLTGYLTQVNPSDLPEGSMPEPEKVFLKIPNEEIKVIFQKTVVSWFHEKVTTEDCSVLFDAMWQGQEEKATELISDLLFQTISYHDYREDFYHAFLAGILTGGGYIVKSNREHGTGRTDLVIRDRSHRRVMLIEAKRANSEHHLEAACAEAVHQIDDRRYGEEFRKGYLSVICYGIAFFEKQCLVKKMDEVVRT